MALMQKTVVVAGCGEIGFPIYQLSRGGYEQVIALDPRFGEPESPKYPVAALHVAIPGSLTNFIEIVSTYAERYAPDIVLVHSSSEPGKTDELVHRLGEEKVVHAQVHGKHTGGKMRSDMLRYPKFIATRSDQAFEKAKTVLAAMGHSPDRIVRLSSPLAGEMAKLLATTFFGYLIVWTQEVERMSRSCGVPFEELMSFAQLETDDFRINDKFPGVIGGHCVMPNIELLRHAHPSPLWDFMVSSNELKKSEK
jgi:hypothetical protein